MRLITVLTLTCLSLAGSGQAQVKKAELQVLPGITLRLGMTKAQVAEKLVGQNIDKVSEDYWSIGTLEQLKAGIDVPKMQFSQGLLIYATKVWTTPATDTAEALFGAVSSLREEGISRCVINADTRALTDIGETTERVWLFCGEKTVLVMRSIYKDGSHIQIIEQIGQIKEVHLSFYLSENTCANITFL